MVNTDNAVIRGVIKETEKAIKKWQSHKQKTIKMDKQNRKQATVITSNMMYCDLHLLAENARLCLYEANRDERPMWKIVPLVERINKRCPSWDNMLETNNEQALYKELAWCKEQAGKIVLASEGNPQCH